MTQGGDRACVLARKALSTLLVPGAYCGSVLALDDGFKYEEEEYGEMGTKKNLAQRVAKGRSRPLRPRNCSFWNSETSFG